MGIKVRDLNVDLKGSTALVTKIVNAEPIRIGAIEIIFEMTEVDDQKNRAILERVAMTCPEFLSLNDDIDKQIAFNWK